MVEQNDLEIGDEFGLRSAFFHPETIVLEGWRRVVSFKLEIREVDAFILALVCLLVPLDQAMGQLASLIHNLYLRSIVSTELLEELQSVLVRQVAQGFNGLVDDYRRVFPLYHILQELLYKVNMKLATIHLTDAVAYLVFEQIAIGLKFEGFDHFIDGFEHIKFP